MFLHPGYKAREKERQRRGQRVEEGGARKGRKVRKGEKKKGRKIAKSALIKKKR
jgi:hypothetical protein